MPRIYCQALLVMIMALIALELFASEVSAPIRFGSVAMDTPAVMHQRLKPLTNYLSEVLDRQVVLKLAPDMKSAIADVINGNVDLAYLTPVAYIRSREAGHTRLLVKTVTKNRASFQLMIVVRDDSQIREVQDLNQKTFAFGDRAAVLQRAVVVGAGLRLEQLNAYDFLGHYDNIVRGVLHKDFDAGILKDTMAYKWQDRGIRIVHTSVHLPPYNLTASANVGDALFQHLQAAFLKLDVDVPYHRTVIKALDKKYNGFVKTNDKEYDVIRTLIAPFDKN